MGREQNMPWLKSLPNGFQKNWLPFAAKRKPWMSEHYQMDIFDAVALALVSPRSF